MLSAKTIAIALACVKRIIRRAEKAKVDMTVEDIKSSMYELERAEIELMKELASITTGNG